MKRLIRFNANYCMFLAFVFLGYSGIMGSSAELFPVYRGITITFIIVGVIFMLFSDA